MNGEDIRDLLKIEHYRSYKGLAQSSLQLLILICLVIVALQQVTPIPGLSFSKLSLVIVSIEVINFTFWFCYRLFSGLIMSKKNRINIAFSVKASPKSRDLYRQLISNFRRQIEIFDKRSNFYIFELPDTFDVKSSKQAEGITKNEKIQLLIWGDTDEGLQNNIYTTVFNLTFTYNFNITSHTQGEFNKKHQLFLSNIQQAIMGRQWSVLEPQSLPHIKVVNENLVETSLYILARCLITFGYMRLGFEYLESLRNQLEGLPDNSFPNFGNFKRMVNDTLLQTSISLTMYFIRVKKDYELAERFAKYSLKLRPTEYASYTQLAIITCLKGDYDGAYRLAKTAKRLNPSSDINRINEAFFALYRGKYKKALSMYHKVQYIPQGTDILPIIDMLEDQAEVTNKPAFLFGAGYMSYHFGDRSRSASLLNTFIDKAIPASEYSELINIAQGLLNSI